MTSKYVSDNVMDITKNHLAILEGKTYLQISEACPNGHRDACQTFPIDYHCIIFATNNLRWAVIYLNRGDKFIPYKLG